MGEDDGCPHDGYSTHNTDGEQMIDVMLEIGIKAVAYMGCGFTVGCLIAWVCEERDFTRWVRKDEQ